MATLRPAAFRHHLDQVAQAQLEPEVPAHTQNDDIPVEMSTSEQFFQVLQLVHMLTSHGSGRQLSRPSRLFAPELCHAGTGVGSTICPT